MRFAPAFTLLLALSACASPPAPAPATEEEPGQEADSLRRLGTAGAQLLLGILEFRAAEERWPGSLEELAGRLAPEERERLAGIAVVDLLAFSDEKASYRFLWEGDDEAGAEGTVTLDLGLLPAIRALVPGPDDPGTSEGAED